MEGEAQVSESTPVENTQPAPSETQEVSRETTQETTEDQESKPSGFDRVEFTPEQKQRVDRIYGNMKRYENDSKEQRALNERLVQTLTDLQQSQHQIVNHLQVSDFQEAEGRLSSERDAAWGRGDINAYNTANDKLNEIKVQKLLSDREKRTQPRQQPVPQKPSGVNGDRIVNDGLERSTVTNVEANIAKSWMVETDPSGNLKRPWTNESDPRNYAAALEGQAVFNSPQWADKPIADKLREIDRRMGTQNVQAGQNVLPAGHLTRPSQNNNIKLSPEIEKIAIKTKFGGPKAKSDQDHIDAWKKAVLKQSKGAKK